MVVLVVRFQAKLGMAGLRLEKKMMAAIESTSGRLELVLSRIPKQAGGKQSAEDAGRGE
jgi:hypothetical protein